MLWRGAQWTCSALYYAWPVRECRLGEIIQNADHTGKENKEDVKKDEKEELELRLICGECAQPKCSPGSSSLAPHKQTRPSKNPHESLTLALSEFQKGEEGNWAKIWNVNVMLRIITHHGKNRSGARVRLLRKMMGCLCCFRVLAWGGQNLSIACVLGSRLPGQREPSFKLL